MFLLRFLNGVNNNVDIIKTSWVLSQMVVANSYAILCVFIILLQQTSNLKPTQTQLVGAQYFIKASQIKDWGCVQLIIFQSFLQAGNTLNERSFLNSSDCLPKGEINLSHLIFFDEWNVYTTIYMSVKALSDWALYCRYYGRWTWSIFLTGMHTFTTNHIFFIFQKCINCFNDGLFFLFFFVHFFLGFYDLSCWLSSIF